MYSHTDVINRQLTLLIEVTHDTVSRGLSTDMIYLLNKRLLPTFCYFYFGVYVINMVKKHVNSCNNLFFCAVYLAKLQTKGSNIVLMHHSGIVIWRRMLCDAHTVPEQYRGIAAVNHREKKCVFK